MYPSRNEHPDADARLRDLYNTEWEWRQEQFADGEDVRRSLSTPIADRLPSVDAASQQMRLRYWESVIDRLDAIRRDELCAAEQINYDVYRSQIEVFIARQRFRDHEMPVNADTSFWSNLGHTARRPFAQKGDHANWIAQMRDIRRYFRERIYEMREGLRRGFTPSRVALQGRDKPLAAIVAAKPEDTLFFAPFKDMTGVPAGEQERLRREAVKGIREVVQPAYLEVLHFMRAEYLPGLRTSTSAADLPDGKAYYRSKIREFTTLDLDPAEIHALGEAEVASLRAQMIEVMKETDFKGDFSEFLAFLRADPSFYAHTADELLMRAAWIAKKFDAKAARFFGRLPRERFAIERVPEDLAPFYTAGRGGAGLYLLNTYQLPSRPLFNLTALTLHESAPGHAFQMSLAGEQTDLPAFRRQSYLSAYGEGWALYCERLGLEMGLYETPYDRFGMLGYQIWRAARLVVDTGLHAMGWSRDQAMAYLRRYTALAEHEIQTEVDRYISWPAQALSYYLGQRAITQARVRAEQALGSKFDIRSFHDTVLDLGCVPLDVLARRIEQFIAAGARVSALR